MGAWARVHRTGRVPTFFYAPFESYKRSNKVWSQYPDAMILKVAESMGLRKAFSITGLVPEDEVGAAYVEGAGGVIDSTAVVIDEEPDWGDDPVLAERLQKLFVEANRVRPGSFLPQKVRLQLAGADQQKRAKIAQDVANFVLRNGGEVPETTPDEG